MSWEKIDISMRSEHVKKLNELIKKSGLPRNKYLRQIIEERITEEEIKE